MSLVSKRNIKNLLKKYQIRPTKRLGQHFLIDKQALKKITEAAELKPGDIILEIGPGIGNLTQELAKKVKKVIAIEKDSKMVEILKETVRNLSNVKIIRADILKFPDSKLPIAKYKVVTNLPFYIVSPVIRKFLEANYPPKEMILLVQREIAQRICAKPQKINLLAVSVQFYAKPKIVSYVSKKSFWPQPKVNGAIIKIIPKVDKNRLAARELSTSFFKIVKAGFSQPRKQLINNLSKSLKIDREKVKNWLWKNKIQPSQRAETLTIEDWLKLTKSLK